jgi:hypothetical protein
MHTDLRKLKRIEGGPANVRCCLKLWQQERRFLALIVLICILSLLAGCGGSSRPALGPPVVTSVSPTSGLAAGGTMVTVNGSHFAFVTPILVYFGGTQADATTVKMLSDNRLTVVAPAGSGVVDVQVHTSLGTSAVTPADKFTYSGPSNYTYSKSFGSYGSGPGQFTVPNSIAADRSGNLYIIDNNIGTANAPTYARVEKFDANGNFLAQFGSYGSGNGQFITPSAIALDASGNIYVTDYGTVNGINGIHYARVEKFNPNGHFLSQFGAYGTGNGQLIAPTTIAVDPSGNIYVGDNGSTSFTAMPRVEKFDSQGNFLLQFGAYGTGNGQFNVVADLTTDSAGNVYIADNSYGITGPTISHRIEKFNAQGNYLSQLGTAQLLGPVAVAVDNAGNVFVADLRQVVYKFDSGGNLLAQIGAQGTGNGQFIDIIGLAIGSGSSVNVLNIAYNLNVPVGTVEIFQPAP